MNREFSKLTALSLSKGCNNHKTTYLKSFELTNSFANKGEMNYFIEKFLYIVSATQKDMILQFKEKLDLFNSLDKRIYSDGRLNKRNIDVMFILAQNYYFSIAEKGLTIKELAEITGRSQQFIRSIIKELDGYGIITQKGERPVVYTISEKYFD